MPISRIAFFLSGHGFGHAVRNSALIDALPAGVEPILFTSIPEAFFRAELRRPFRIIPCEIDCGCLQTDALEVDMVGTLERYRELDAARAESVPCFSSLLRESGADLVLGDIPPLAFPIAKAAGIPAWAMGNFTWLDIYRPYVRLHPRFAPLLQSMEADYAQAGRHLRLFPALPGPFPVASEDTGMLCRTGVPRRREFARRFGLDERKKWCLVYLGGYGLAGVDWRALRKLEGWEFLGLYPPDLPAGEVPNYHLVEKDLSFRYADLTASCEAVLGKLGYGLVTESLALGKPILFLPREHFEEYPLLKRTVEDRGLGREISLDQFQRLDLGEELETLSGRRIPPLEAVGAREILAKMGFSPG